MCVFVCFIFLFHIRVYQNIVTKLIAFALADLSLSFDLFGMFAFFFILRVKFIKKNDDEEKIEPSRNVKQ